MKRVTFNRAMRGLGNPAIIPDDAAAAAYARGELVGPPEDFPAGSSGPKPTAAAPKPVQKPQTYLTKAGKRLRDGAASLLVIFALLASLLWSPPSFAQSLPSKWLSAASTNSTLVNGVSTLLTAILPINTTTTLYYLKLYDKATAPVCGTDTPKWTIPIPFGASNSGGGVSLPLPPGGLHFFSGLGWCLTGGLADNDTSNAATGIAINMAWTNGQ